jgi:hypothetical protein
MNNDEQQTHWLSGAVNFAQLIAAALTLAAALGASLLFNDRRITTLEVARDYGMRRNDGQDSEIERLRAIASQNQRDIGAINAKMDFIIARQDSVINALNRAIQPAK